MQKSALSRVPLLRILLPFIAGIILADCYPSWLTVALPLLSGVIVFAAMTLSGRSPVIQLKYRSWWIIPLLLMSMGAGALSMRLWIPSELDLHQVNGRIVTGEIKQIDYYDFSMRMLVNLHTVDSQAISPHTVLITTRGCNYELREGNLVQFKCQLAPITNLGNPDEFDRQNVLWQQGILYSQHLPKEKLWLMGHHQGLKSIAGSFRQSLLTSIYTTKLQPACKELMVALLLGHSQFMSNSIRSQFSAAGIAHILALSGLHVALITSLIWFILFPLDYLRLKKLRLALTLMALIAYVFLTGLPISAIRAAIMIGFTFAGFVFYRRSVALNAMCASALLTLCVWPTAIYQAGFQLSYITAGAIILTNNTVSSKHRLFGGLLILARTSAVAMLATIMLSAYYFNSISLVSIVSNVLILPVMPTLIVLGAIFLFLAAAGIEWSAFNWCIEHIYHYMTTVVSCVTKIPGSHISGVYVTGASVWLFYLCLACVLLWLYTHRSRWLIVTLSSILLLVVQLGWVKWQKPSHGVIVLNDYRSTPILWYDNGIGYVWFPDNPTPDQERFMQTHRRLLAHIGVDSLHLVEDKVKTGHSMVNTPLAVIDGVSMAVPTKGLIKQMSLQQLKQDIDLLIITKRYHGTVADIIKHFNCKLVLISGGIPADRSKTLQLECERLSIPYQFCPWQPSHFMDWAIKY